LDMGQVRAWLQSHPGGVVITFKHELPEDLGVEAFERFRYRGGETTFWRLAESEP